VCSVWTAIRLLHSKFVCPELEGELDISCSAGDTTVLHYRAAETVPGTSYLLAVLGSTRKPINLHCFTIDLIEALRIWRCELSTCLLIVPARQQNACSSYFILSVHHLPHSHLTGVAVVFPSPSRRIRRYIACSRMRPSRLQTHESTGFVYKQEIGNLDESFCEDG
jgi:hypothetical protein